MRTDRGTWVVGLGAASLEREGEASVWEWGGQ